MAKVINIGAGGGSSDAELVTNKTTIIDKNSTDTQYPSAKAVRQFVYGVSGLPDMDDLDNMSWADIRAISKANQGANYFEIGAEKKIVLNGKIGTYSASNLELYVYILGFNHNSTYEGNGITFGTFKTHDGNSTSIDVCLVNTDYNSASFDGTKTFNLNHWGTDDSTTFYNTNYGGWAGCDLRYDVLGSTNVQPSGYGVKATTSRTGYDPSNYDIVNSPIADTMLAAFPSELRAVMQPMTKYTDNVGGGNDTSSNVSATIDYLPLLAEFEIFGSKTYANSAEKNFQLQYDYYKAGNSKKKYRHSSITSAAYWWERSPYYNIAFSFCSVNTSGNASNASSRLSRGLAPAFKV